MIRCLTEGQKRSLATDEVRFLEHGVQGMKWHYHKNEDRDPKGLSKHDTKAHEYISAAISAARKLGSTGERIVKTLSATQKEARSRPGGYDERKHMDQLDKIEEKLGDSPKENKVAGLIVGAKNHISEKGYV